MFTRLAQVVFTLTQFPTVDGVRFKLDGKLIDTLGGEGIIIDEPLDRDDYEDMSPAILVESPTVGATLRSPMRITGTANVFEAVFIGQHSQLGRAHHRGEDRDGFFGHRHPRHL